MKKWIALLVAFLICAGPISARAAESSTAANNVPGKEIAQHLSMLTGVAISPLLGIGAIGAYQYCVKAKTVEERAKLPWFAHPAFWIPALLIVVACFVKDTAGTALPTAAKKPLDVIEAIEHKISGLIAAGAFVPLMAMIFHHANSTGDGASLSNLGFAAIDLSWLGNAIMVPISLAIFIIVFLASNAINILILLSPFTTVDAALKGFRTVVLGTVVATSLANPWMGAAWALVIIFFAWLIAGWSFRLSHFGLVLCWDFCTFRSSRFTPDKTENKIFLWRKINKVPARTYGKLKRDEKGNLVVTYRPWLVLPPRTLVLPEGNYAVGKAVFWQSIQRVNGEDSQNMLLLPPRYRGHEEELVKIYNLSGVRDAGLRRAWKWMKELFTGKPQAVPVATATA